MAFLQSQPRWEPRASMIRDSFVRKQRAVSDSAAAMTTTSAPRSTSRMRPTTAATAIGGSDSQLLDRSVAWTNMSATSSSLSTGGAASASASTSDSGRGSSSSGATTTDREYVQRMLSRSLHDERTTCVRPGADVDADVQRNSLPANFPFAADLPVEGVPAMVRHGTDPHLNDRYYAAEFASGRYVKAGWLTKQGHIWKSWKMRFFVLFQDGTLAYYKSKNKRKMKGCMNLNDGVVSVQHVDSRRSGKQYVFEVEKGFYQMWCSCCSQLEAELWVNALRSTRMITSKPPVYEALLTAGEELAGTFAITRHLNKIFITDASLVSMMNTFKGPSYPHSIESVFEFIMCLEEMVMDRHLGELYKEPEVEMMSGNELTKLIRRHVEDRVFLPLAPGIYSRLDNSKLRSSRSSISKHIKQLKSKSQEELGIPSDIAALSDWKHIQAIVHALDCVSLPSHKLDLILTAGSKILTAVAQHHGSLVQIDDQTMTCIFRHVIINTALDDLAMLRALLNPMYSHHPTCHNKSDVVKAFLDAIKWIEGYHADDDGRATSMSLASTRVVVSISTVDVGVLMTTDGNSRGAIVQTIRKLSQAALSGKIEPGLSLIAVNDEPVLLMPGRDVCHRLRTAALPKRLTFLPEFYYYQLLSLDVEMYQYLLCIAAERGDHDSVSWLIGSEVDINALCSWEQTRGKQVFGFMPPSCHGTALHAATWSGQLAMVEYLISCGADPSVRDRKGRTPLHVAPNSPSLVQLLRCLHKGGAGIETADFQGLTPLMTMVFHGLLDGVATLLERGASVDSVAWSNGYSALEFAVQVGNAELVQVLLDKGANPNRVTADGDTSLHIAAAHAHERILELLIGAGGAVNQQNRFGQSPAAVMLLAVTADNPNVSGVEKCLELLANAGLSSDTHDLFGRRLLHVAHLSNNYRVRSMVGRLTTSDDELRRGVDIFGCTPRDYCLNHLPDGDVAHLRCRDPSNEWKKGSSEINCTSSGQGRSIFCSRSVEELMQVIVHDVSATLTDVITFILFLETFTDLDAVIKHLREVVSNGCRDRGFLRFVVLLEYFKLRHTKAHHNQMFTELYGLVERHSMTAPCAGDVLVEHYAKLYDQYFSLRGGEDCLKSYRSLPDMLVRKYGAGQTVGNIAIFPRNLCIQADSSRFAEQCTLLTHSLFSCIPVEDFTSTGSKASHSVYFIAAKRWFQHLTAYVINAVLVEETCEGRADAITFFLEVAECCLSLRNFDSLAAILYALQSTAVQRLHRTMECLSVSSKKLLNRMQFFSDKGCREMNKLMHDAPVPSMPYIGLYLQGFTGLNELPKFDKDGLVNGNRLQRMGELAVTILHRKAVAYALAFDDETNNLLHVTLPYDTDESRYTRSLKLEPREAGSVPLGDRGMNVPVDDLDIDSHVRESLGAEGTFGIRQWFRKQKVVYRARSRSAMQTPTYEWV